MHIIVLTYQPEFPVIRDPSCRRLCPPPFDPKTVIFETKMENFPPKIGVQWEASRVNYHYR